MHRKLEAARLRDIRALSDGMGNKAEHNNDLTQLMLRKKKKNF